MQQGGVSNLCLPLQSMAIIVEMYGNVGHSLCSLCSMLFSCSFLILTWHFRIADVLDEPQQAEQSRVTATYSLTYSLPAVPNDIQFSIERHQSGQYFKARSRVVQWLYHDPCLSTMYPGKLYNEAAQALVSRYPNLADSSGTGYDSWRDALRFKAKYERRKIRIQQNDGADSPPSKKPTKDGKVATVGGNALQRVSRPSVATAPDGEDEESIAGHIEGMKSAVQKARPDMA
ncbi:uncharacterized protein LOC144134843, partial [Amblyomma americanum]